MEMTYVCQAQHLHGAPMVVLTVTRCSGAFYRAQISHVPFSVSEVSCLEWLFVRPGLHACASFCAVLGGKREQDQRIDKNKRKLY